MVIHLRNFIFSSWFPLELTHVDYSISMSACVFVTVVFVVDSFLTRIFSGSLSVYFILITQYFFATFFIVSSSHAIIIIITIEWPFGCVCLPIFFLSLKLSFDYPVEVSRIRVSNNNEINVSLNHNRNFYK